MTELTFDEWLDYGVTNDYCGPIVCSTHDGIPTTELEDAEMNEYDVCLPIIRPYASIKEKKSIERNHCPSSWRRTNAHKTDASHD